MVTDPVSDMLITIKNAVLVRKETASVSYSKLKMAVALVLEKEGFIKKAEHKGKKAKKAIEIALAYDEDKNSVITDVKRISKPSARTYSTVKDLLRLNRSEGIVIVSTSKGVMTAREAKRDNLGGEVLCRVW